MAHLKITNCLSFTEFFEGIFRFEGNDYEVIYSQSFNSKKGGINHLSHQVITLERFGESYPPNHPVHQALLAHLQEQKWSHTKAA